MNINSISFKGNYRNTDNKTYRNTSRRNNDTRYRDEFQHSNIISPRYPNTKNKSGKKLLAIPFATATLGTTVALMLTFSNPSPAEPPKNIQFNPNETNITEIAEENNCDLDFLLDYNNIGPNTDLSSISEVLVPSSFDYLQTEIERIEELLKDVKYFNRIYVEPVDFGSNYIVDFVYIEVDDWKHCTYVKNYLDNNGIATSYNESEKFYTDYASASTYANIIKYFVVILSFVILTVSCANIIKNENKNLKLLSVIGYSKKNIRKITSIQILSLLFAGCFIGIIISEVLIKILMNILDIPIHKDLILTISLDILMVLLPTFIMTRRKSDLKF